MSPHAAKALDRLGATAGERYRLRPVGSYTARLLREGPGLPARKVGEEAVGVILTALAADQEALVRVIGNLVHRLAVPLTP